jgi:hypothetical protein
MDAIGRLVGELLRDGAPKRDPEDVDLLMLEPIEKAYDGLRHPGEPTESAIPG